MNNSEVCVMRWFGLRRMRQWRSAKTFDERESLIVALAKKSTTLNYRGPASSGYRNGEFAEIANSPPGKTELRISA